MSKVLFKDHDEFEKYEKVMDALEDLGKKTQYNSFVFECITESKEDNPGYQWVEFLTDFEFYIGKTLYMEVDDNNDFIVKTDLNDKGYIMKIRGSYKNMDHVIFHWPGFFEESHKIGQEVLDEVEKYLGGKI